MYIKCREAKFRETVFWRSSNVNDGEFGDGYDEHFHVIETFVSELMQLYTADIAKLLNVVCEEVATDLSSVKLARTV